MYHEQDIPFIFEDGVLRPEVPIDLPEGTRGVARIRESSKDTVPFDSEPTLEELRKQQGTLPIQSISDLAGDWPEEDSIDDFLDFIRRGRK